MALGPAAGAAVAAAAPVVSRLSQTVSPLPVRGNYFHSDLKITHQLFFFFVIPEMVFVFRTIQARTWAASTFKRAYDDSKASTRQHQLLTAVEHLINAYIRSLHYLDV